MNAAVEPALRSVVTGNEDEVRYPHHGNDADRRCKHAHRSTAARAATRHHAFRASAALATETTLRAELVKRLSGRGCRAKSLKQSAMRVVGAEGAEWCIGRVELWRASSDEEELEIEAELAGSIVDGCLDTATIG